MKRKLLLFIPILFGMALGSCGGGDTPPAPPTPKEDFVDVYFDDASFTYDGQEHILGEVRGAPEGTNITYTARVAHIDVGSYEATALLEKDGYNNKTLTATLTINPAEFSDITMSDLAVDYDGKEHKYDIEPKGSSITGGCSFTYHIYNEASEEVNTAKDAGTYKVDVTVSKANYVSKTLSATLTIRKATFPTITVQGKTVTYNGEDRINEITYTADLPEGTTVNKVVTNSNNEEVTEAILPDTYKVTLTFVNKNYQTATYHVNLVIGYARFPSFTLKAISGTYDGHDFADDIDLSFVPSYATATIRIKKDDVDVSEAVLPGVYNYSVTLSATGYYDVVNFSTITIEELEYGDLSYESKVVGYDGQDHFSDIQLVGQIPSTATVKVTVTNESGGEVTEAREVGRYTYVCLLTAPGYPDKEFTAYLTIMTLKEKTPLIKGGDGFYFMNKLDNDYLYKYDSTDGIKKVSSTVVFEFESNNGQSDVYFVSKSLLGNSAKLISGGSISTLLSEGGLQSYVRYTDTIALFSIKNTFSSEKNGIYLLDSSDSNSEPVVTKVFSGKAKDLRICDDLYVFFINESDNDRLYVLNIANDYKCFKVTEESIHEYLVDGAAIYLSINGKVNDSIAVIKNYHNSPDVVELTNMAGEKFCIEGSYLYFIAKDWATLVHPEWKGVWKLDPVWKTVSQIYSYENVNDFVMDGYDNVMFIDNTNYHLYKYQLSTTTLTDLMAEFVPSDDAPKGKGKSISYEKERSVYYINPRADFTLFSYDWDTKVNQQITSEKVTDFSIIGDTIYYNLVTRLVNNDLYKMDLDGKSDPVKISTNDLREMVSDGQYIYGVHYNFLGQAAGLARMDLDGSNYFKFSDINGAKNLAIKNGKLYFINENLLSSDYIEYIDLSLIDPSVPDQDLKSTKCNSLAHIKQFAFDDNDNLIYIYSYLTTNSVRRTTLSSLGSTYVDIAKSNTKAEEIYVTGLSVYYFNSYSSGGDYSKMGLYSVYSEAEKDGTAIKYVGSYLYGTFNYYMSSFAFAWDDLIFMNYFNGEGNCYIYKYDSRHGGVSLLYK